MHFTQALEEHNVPEEDINEFMSFIGSFEHSVCVRPGDSGLATLEQVRQNKLYHQLVEDLQKKLEDIYEEEPDDSLKPFIDQESTEYKDLNDRVACLLSNMDQEDFGLTEDDLNLSDQADEVNKKIAETLGELLEELQIDCDSVD